MSGNPAPTRRWIPSPAQQRVVAVVIGLLVLVQAVIAGQSNVLFGSWDIEVHGYIGNAVFLFAFVNLGFVVLGRAGSGPTITAALLALAVFAQTGLGYVGRESASAASAHIPLGVATFGIAVWNLALAMLPAEKRSS